MILEIEEIYGDVIQNQKQSIKELKYFQLANSYMFSTELLEQKINKKGKSYVINYGTYKAEEDRSCKFNDSKIHCVYAGTFDPQKGGAAAAAAAAYLSEKYHIHIIGFGNKQDTIALQNQILELSKNCDCAVTFDGLKSGEDYIRFIQSCDIGLSTQTPDGLYNATSFPSKILSYMANGLHVVSISIPAIKLSAIGKYLYYFDEYKPECIAEAIEKIDLTAVNNNRKIINGLHEKFIQDMASLLFSTIND